MSCRQPSCKESYTHCPSSLIYFFLIRPRNIFQFEVEVQPTFSFSKKYKCCSNPSRTKNILFHLLRCPGKKGGKKQRENHNESITEMQRENVSVKTRAPFFTK